MTSKVGHQFATPVDWVEGRQRLFKDAFKTARDFEPVTKGGPAVQLNADGWPLSDARCTIFTEGGPGANGDYLTRFKPVNTAAARIVSGGGSPADFSPPVVNTDGFVYQKITVRAKPTETPQLHIVVQGTGGGFSGLKVLRPGFTNFDEVDAVAPFNPEPINLLKDVLDAGCLRLMGWLKTNSSTVVEYADFTEPTDMFWRANEGDPDDRGCPYEFGIEMAGLVDCDVWVNHPHMGSDNCARQMATMALALLPRNRRAVVEYSNETWNTDYRFTQSQYCQQQGTKLQLAGDTRFHPTSKETRGGQWSTMRSCQVFRIWQNVWGSESYRLRHVVAGQASNPDVLNIRRKWLREHEDAKTLADVWGYAVTGYFGPDNVFTNRADFKSEDLFKQGYTIGTNVWPGIYLDDRTKLWSWPNQQQFLAACREDKKTANVYEGGLSLGEADLKGVPDDVKAAVRAEKVKAQEDPRIQQYVKQGVGGFFAQAGDLAGYFMYFLFSNKWGTDVYGLVDDVGKQSGPKVAGVVEVAKANPLSAADPTEDLLLQVRALKEQNAQLVSSNDILQTDNVELKRVLDVSLARNASFAKGVADSVSLLQSVAAQNA